MPYRKRLRSEPTDDWSQLQLQLAWPEQISYELIRPVVLFGFSAAERAKQTGVPELPQEGDLAARLIAGSVHYP